MINTRRADAQTARTNKSRASAGSQIQQIIAPACDNLPRIQWPHSETPLPSLLHGPERTLSPILLTVTNLPHEKFLALAAKRFARAEVPIKAAHY